jgi:uncharacterized protein (DUF983 family)
MVGATFTVAAAGNVIRSSVGISAIGNAQVSTAQSQFGGASALFDGSGDWLVSSDTISLSTNDYTVECWMRTATADRVIFDNRTGTQPAVFAVSNTGKISYYDPTTGGAVGSTTTITNSAWHHLAWVRSGSTFKMYVNGVAEYTNNSYSVDLGTNRPFRIGAEYTGNFNFNGYIDELRVSNSARYTANFTSPTAPFTNDNNTLLLLHMNGTNASTVFIDDNGVRARNDFRCIGNARISTTRSQFSGSSAYFDGTGDYAIGAQTISFPDNQDFTWEFWYNEDVSQNHKLIGGQSANDIFIGRDGNAFSGRLGVGIVSVGWYMDFGVTPALDTWHHVAVVRTGDVVKGYLNGELKVTHTGGLINYNWRWTNPVLGAETTGNTPFNGYLDEIRWSNTARYTANFTPSTAPFVNDANTVCLLHCNGTNASTAIVDDNGSRTQRGIRAIGNSQISTAQSNFGGASALFDGTGDYLLVNQITLPTIKTIECWIRLNNVSTEKNIFRFHNSSDTFSWVMGVLNANIYVFAGGTTTGGSVTTNTWTHICLTDNGTAMQLAVNGVFSGSRGTIGSELTNAIIYLGGETGSSGMNGYIDELRISDNVRYTANFTPSTTPFVNDSNTLLLLHMNGTNASTVFIDDNA